MTPCLLFAFSDSSKAAISRQAGGRIRQPGSLSGPPPRPPLRHLDGADIRLARSRLARADLGLGMGLRPLIQRSDQLVAVSLQVGEQLPLGGPARGEGMGPAIAGTAVEQHLPVVVDPG